jgi:integrase
MSNLRRIPYTKPLPPGAEVFTRKGKRLARWKDGKSRTREAPVNEDGTRMQLLSRKWYGEYRDADGLEKCVALSTDRTAAELMLADLVRKAELGRGGVVDPFEKQRKVLLVCPLCRSKGQAEDGMPCDCPGGAHLSDYRRGLLAKEKDERYVFQAVAHCAAVFDGTGARFVHEIDANKVEGWLADLRHDTGVGLSTSNHYLTSAKGFTRWLTKTRPPRWPSDALACLAKLNEEMDVRKQRRDMTADEAARLLGTTLASGRSFRGLTGRDRYWLYAVAFQSGLRAGELASLLPSSFVLDHDPPVIRLKARRSKRRRNDTQPLPQELAEALRPWLAGKPAGQPVWPGTWAKRAWEMIGRDLAEARAAWVEEASQDAAERKRREESDYLVYEDRDGRTFDFHATRHSYITLLARSGAHPKTAQDLARHSTVDLTMNHYTHLRLRDLAGAVEGLPSILPNQSAAAALRATGTDPATPASGAGSEDPPAESLRPACAAGEAGRGLVRGAETPGNDGAERPTGLNPSTVQGDEAGCESMRAVEGRVGEGTRTPDIQIHRRPETFAEKPEIPQHSCSLRTSDGICKHRRAVLSACEKPRIFRMWGGVARKIPRSGRGGCRRGSQPARP